MINATVIAPGIVEMKDTDRQVFTVDTDLYTIIRNRRVWTHPETGYLMIDEVCHHQKQTVMSYPLAAWWYRIMSLSDLPSANELNIRFDNDDCRDVRYKNLVRLAKRSHAPMTYKPKKPTQNLTPDSRLVLSEGKALSEKLLDVPTRLHVDYLPFGDSPVYFAVWKENGKTYCMQLGQDIGGKIAKRITEQTRREDTARQRRDVRVANEQARQHTHEWIPFTCTDPTHTTTQLNCAGCIEAHTLNMRHKKMFEREEGAA